jgi:uncharacterized protein (DUF1697 family)
MNRYKRLSEISKLLGKHTNTIAKWCDAIEDAGVHQFERVNGERVFSDFDQTVVKYISDKRDDKWPMQQIIKQVQIDLDLMAHVEHMESTVKEYEIPSADMIKQQIIDAMQQAIDRAVQIQVQQIKDHYEQMVAALPKPKDESEQQMAIISAMMRKEQIEEELRQEAIAKWMDHPERKRRAFLWIWKEDHEKREKYIKNYIKQRMHEKISQNAFEIVEKKL